jgi:hypothetical protein
MAALKLAIVFSGYAADAPRWPQQAAKNVETGEAAEPFVCTYQETALAVTLLNDEEMNL